MSGEYITRQVEMRGGDRRDRIVQKHDGLYRYCDYGNQFVTELKWDSTVNKWVCERPDIHVDFPIIRPETISFFNDYTPMIESELAWDSHKCTHVTEWSDHVLYNRVNELKNSHNYGWEYGE